MSCLLWRAGTGTSAVEAGVVVVVVAVVVSVPLVSVGLFSASRHAECPMKKTLDGEVPWKNCFWTMCRLMKLIDEID